MQAFTTGMVRLGQCPEDPNDDQGFAEQQIQSLIIPKHQIHDELAPKTTRPKPKVLYRQPKVKLTFLNQKKQSRQQLRRSLINKEQRSQAGRSIDLSKRDSRKSIAFDLLAECVCKIKRSLVGENISIPIFGLADSKIIKNYIIFSGGALLYEQAKQTNTHGFVRGLSEQTRSPIANAYNQLMQHKIKQSYIMPRRSWHANSTKPLSFQGDFQCANLEFASEVGENHYELYLRNDTNTHGHQSWFLFRLKNNKKEEQNPTLHVCNLKRNLPHLTEGGKVYLRKIGADDQPSTEWQPAGENVQFKYYPNAKFTNAKVYRLTFTLKLQPDQQIQVGLLPAYTYTDLMNDVLRISACQHATVEVLTYSLVGLAVPLLTFTRGDNPNKQVVLVNCRIHPGQTNSSFMAKGFMQWLTQDNPQTKDFLEKYIIKIVPMLNPDGVILGNFRTNFLGIDLNRSFDSEDEVTNPQISALKELGLRLKDEHGERFNLFIDLHGHSAEKNIFAYGPDFESTQTNFYQIRLLPKILNLRSKMFKYHCCTFKLQDYKRNTARGYFLNTISTLAYTIQAGYGFFQEDGKNMAMGPSQWTQFGRTLGEGLNILSRLNRLSAVRNRTDIKKALGEADKEQIQIIKKFKKEFKQEKQQPPKIDQKKKQRNGQDSDGQGDLQDYNRAERQQVIRRVAQSVAPNTVLPRVLKPSIVYPTVTPKLFKYRDQLQQTHIKILYTKRSYRYSGMRMPGNGYIHSMRGLQLLRPEAKNLLS